MVGQGTRSWAGIGLPERQRIRRAELIEAGIDLLGAPDGPAVSVRAVCRACGLTERYFYESFGDREQFVAAVYDEVARRAHGALVDAVAGADAATRAEAAVRAFVTLMVDRPAMGRVLLIAPTRESSLGGRGIASAPGFAALIGEQLRAIDDTDERRMLAVGLVGALAGLFTGYLDGTLVVSRERLVVHCVELLARAYAWQRG